MKNILLLVHDDAGQEARLQAALDVTRAVEGHLTCVDVSIMPPVVAIDYIESTGTIFADAHVQETRNRVTLEKRLAVEGVPWDWIDVLGSLSDCIAASAELSDLIVINRKLDDYWAPDMRAAAGEVLMKSDTPIFAVPENSRGVDVCGTAMVAWDGSAEARTALRAAIPLLKLASKVLVMEINSDSKLIGHDGAAAYLSRHGIKSEVRREHSRRPVAEVLLCEVKAVRPDYVVMGGYGHSRLTEALIGGVTRTMLNESPCPLFLAR